MRKVSAVLPPLDDDKFWLLNNAYRPSSSFKYPYREEYGKKRTFQYTWLWQFPWLCYSETQNEDHFEKGPRNARYHSPQIQNDLISCTGKWIKQQILEVVKSARFFSISADEAADCSNKEQLPIVLRFVDASCTAREEFVAFLLCDTGITGAAIAEKILGGLKGYGLDLGCLRGQSYDGTGNMAGKYHGAAAIIQTTCSKAVYMHCAAHNLNLCVGAACSVQTVKNLMGTLVEICFFFSNSPKRQGELEKQIERSQENTKAKKLASLCKTRWAARIDALEVLLSYFSSLLRLLAQVLQVGGIPSHIEQLRASYFVSPSITSSSP